MHTDVTTPESESGLLQVRGGSEVLFALFVSPHRSPGVSSLVVPTVVWRICAIRQPLPGYIFLAHSYLNGAEERQPDADHDYRTGATGRHRQLCG